VRAPSTAALGRGSELARAAKQTLVVQVNGRVRDRLEVEQDITEEEAVRLALASDRVKRSLGNKTPVRIVTRPVS